MDNSPASSTPIQDNDELRAKQVVDDEEEVGDEEVSWGRGRPASQCTTPSSPLTPSIARASSPARVSRAYTIGGGFSDKSTWENALRPPRLAIVMVGLPARGKSFIARKVARFLNWLGHETRVFNVGSYRRETLGAKQPHGYFDSKNEEGVASRERVVQRALDDMASWYRNGGDIAVLDATNTTVERRKKVYDALSRSGNVRILFIETICNDPKIVEANVRETKIDMPDYEGVSHEEAITDFKQRIHHYEEVYVPVNGRPEDGESDLSYVKLIDMKKSIILNCIEGYIPGRVVFFLLNLHVKARPVYLIRHGQSLFNLESRIGGDPPLSKKGWEFARRLGDFINQLSADGEVLSVWTSTLQRSVQTANFVRLKLLRWRQLTEIDAGICDGLTYKEIEEIHPDVWAHRNRDKLRYRYPQGESYVDVIARVEPVLLEVERLQDPVLIVSHQAVLRTIYAYFKDVQPSRLPKIEIPSHTVIKLTPHAYGCKEERFVLGPAIADYP